ncbi:MAG: hypothetical protein JO027_06170 [Solirubrobacterales bacterium]|nr:hypothetical protein [Solirubrobacterales bacterium]
MAKQTGPAALSLIGLLSCLALWMAPYTTATTTPAPVSPTAGPPIHSAWNEPALGEPITITISDADRNLKLDRAKDYILDCPSGRVPLSWPLVVWGGRNVVFQDCDIDVTIRNWAAAFKNQAGTLWVHDVHFGGGRLTGGIQLQEPAATVVLRDVLFDRVHGSFHAHHAECLQTWAGPRRLLVDGFTCPTTYQGVFLLPNQLDHGPAPAIFDLRHIDVDDSRGAVALWLGDVTGGLSAVRLNLQDVYVVPNPARTWRGWWLWPRAGIWNGVRAGPPPGGHYVHPAAAGASGIDEGVSPVPLPRELP